MVRSLREPRYAALSLLMLVVATVCVGAGTWQIARFLGKVDENDALRANAHARQAAVASVLPPVGRPAPSADAVRYRPVVATGHYDDAQTSYVRLRSVGGTDGDLVLTPLDTHNGVVLVVRGLRSTGGDGFAAAPRAPHGTVTVRARAETSEPNRDSPAQVRAGQLLSINAPAQAARLHSPVLDGYVELLPGQPGTAKLLAIPPPDLSNPAGGAVEPQHFAYIVQWYLFAVLALAAPFAMIRADRKQRETDAAQPGEQTDEQRRAAKLADRYGRAAPR